MPILAGRALSLGRIDLIGILLALGVLTWIPSHIMPLTIRYLADYQRAGVPTFPSAYGLKTTRLIISAAVTFTMIVMLIAASLSDVGVSYLVALGCLGLALLIMAILNMVNPASKLNTTLFKFASLYMLGAMILIIVG